MKLLWLTNIPSPYRVDFFNELGKQCELTVLFEKRSASDRDDSWKNFDAKNFTAVFLKGIPYGVAEAFCPGVVRYLNPRKYDKIIITNYSDLTGILAVATMRMKKIPYIIESDGAFAGSGKGVKETVKRWLLKKSALCFSTSSVHDSYYEKYGVTSDRIVRYPFTSLRDTDVIDKPIAKEQKQKLREKLGIAESKVLVAVGQFIPRKGFDILIKAMARIDGSVGCYIVGGEPTDEYIRQVSALELNNVHFVGFKGKNDLAEYYMAAD
jgi:glycosyltransferase involved in cell wall biosynthesis